MPGGRGQWFDVDIREATHTQPSGDVAQAPRRRVVVAAPSWRDALGPEGLVYIALLAGAFIWFYWDHIVRLSVFWQQPDWSHGYLILPFSLYLVHMRKDQILAARGAGSFVGLGLMLFSFAAYLWFILAKINTPQPLTMVPMIAGLVLLMCGWRVLMLTAFPIAFLALAIPPPDRMYKLLTHPLQQFAAAISTAILNAFPQAIVEREGTNISFFMKDTGRSGAFEVAGACSGMRSLMAFVALGLMIAFLRDRPAWQRAAMAICVIPVALFCNCMRVVITGAFQMYDQGDLATGTPHSTLGLAMFGLGLGIYMGLLWIFERLFDATDEPSATSVENGS